MNSGGLTKFTGTVTNLASLETDAGGASEFVGDVSGTGSMNIKDATTLRGASYSTTGTQTYAGVTLAGGATRTFTGTTVSFGSRLDATTAGEQGAVITGNASFGDSVGATKALRSLSVSGTTTIGGAGDRTISTSSGDATFGNTLTGNGSALTVNSGGLTKFTGTVTNLASLETDAGGGVQVLQGVSTTGNQTYRDADGSFSGTFNAAAFEAVGRGSFGGTFNATAGFTAQGAATLIGATTVSAGDATFGNTLTGNGSALTVNSGGLTKFTGTVTNLASLETDAGGGVQVLQGVSTTGNQTYRDADGSFSGTFNAAAFEAVGRGSFGGTFNATAGFTAQGAATLIGVTTVSAGDATFGGTIDGSGPLTVQGRGLTRLAGRVTLTAGDIVIVGSRVELQDLNAMGDIVVRATRVEFLRRDPGPVDFIQQFSGATPRNDFGTDVWSNGAVVFTPFGDATSVSVSLGGGGSANPLENLVFIATPTGQFSVNGGDAVAYGPLAASRHSAAFAKPERALQPGFDFLGNEEAVSDLATVFAGVDATPSQTDPDSAAVSGEQLEVLSTVLGIKVESMLAAEPGQGRSEQELRERAEVYKGLRDKRLVVSTVKQSPDAASSSSEPSAQVSWERWGVQTTVADVGFTQARAQAIIDQLEALGWVSKELSPEGGKSKYQNQADTEGQHLRDWLSKAKLSFENTQWRAESDGNADGNDRFDAVKFVSHLRASTTDTDAQQRQRQFDRFVQFEDMIERSGMPPLAVKDAKASLREKVRPRNNMNMVEFVAVLDAWRSSATDDSRKVSASVVFR